MKITISLDRRPLPLAALAGVGLGWCLVASALLAGAPANAGESKPPPMLRITVDNARTSADVGDELSYDISVENIGAVAVSDLRVTQTMPDGLTLESADGGGAARKGVVVWSMDLAAGRTRALHSTMTVGPTPDEVLRMASVACASLSSATTPLVCATHSAELPAGAAASSEAAADPDQSTGPSKARLAGLGIGLLVLAAAGALVVRRQTR